MFQIKASASKKFVFLALVEVAEKIESNREGTADKSRWRRRREVEGGRRSSWFPYSEIGNFI